MEIKYVIYINIEIVIYSFIGYIAIYVFYLLLFIYFLVGRNMEKLLNFSICETKKAKATNLTLTPMGWPRYKITNTDPVFFLAWWSKLARS